MRDFQIFLILELADSFFLGASWVRDAEAVLQPNQIQDLSNQIGEIAKAAVGLNPKFTIHIELGIFISTIR